MVLHIFIILTVQLLAIRGVGAFPTGAGFGACQTLTPTHGAALTGVNPFTITVQQAQSDLEVTLSSTDNTEFAGFIIQAREFKGLNQNPLGSFSDFPDSTRGTFCSLDNSDTATHSDTTPKTSLTFLWTPPADIDDKTIQFHATVAIDKENWWDFIVSEEITFPLPDEAKPSSTASSTKPHISIGNTPITKPTTMSTAAKTKTSTNGTTVDMTTPTSNAHATTSIFVLVVANLIIVMPSILV